MSQRTYKLLQLKDKTERKSSVLQRLSAVVSDLVGDSNRDELGQQMEQVQNRWSQVTEPVQHQYIRSVGGSGDQYFSF